jgi:hypothetical protein
VTARSRFTLALQRFVLRTGRRPRGRQLWRGLSRAVASSACAFLTQGERGASVYERGGSADDFLPGMSDIDLAILVPGDPGAPGAARRRVTGRWERLSRIAALRLVLDWPRIYEESELDDVAGKSVFSLGPGSTLDTDRLLARPGLYGSTADWRLLSGPERRPAEQPRDRQAQRVAAWLELVYWWRWVFPTCADPRGPRAADLSVKFVAEAARIWLWLARGERATSRAEALRRALRALPEEERLLRETLELRRALPAAAEEPLADALRALVRLSERIAALITDEVAEAGVTEVRLAGAEGELVLPRGGGGGPLLPLADWRGVVVPSLPDECLVAVPGDPADPVAIGDAARARPAGPYPTLRSKRLLILPSVPWWRNRLRSVQCPASDPVSFALLDGASTAAFAAVPGWAAGDWADRAVAAHVASLGTGSGELDGRALGRLFTAARAALFHASLHAGEPALALTLAETAERLAACAGHGRSLLEDAVDAYRGFCDDGRRPPERTVAALRELVLGLPAYAESSGRSAAQLRSWSRPIQ